MLETSNDFKGVKRLPKDEKGKPNGTFSANGKKYFIRSPEECITIERWTIYENLSLMYGFDRTLQTIANKVKDTKDTLNAILRGDNSKNVVELIQEMQSLLDGMKHRSDAKYSVALYICTLFIVGENEDISEWSYSYAKSKIEDWAAEGYSVVDFFLLARTMQADFIAVLKTL